MSSSVLNDAIHNQRGVPVVLALLRQCEDALAWVRAKDADGRLPLHLVFQTNFFESTSYSSDNIQEVNLVEALVKLFPESLEVKDCTGYIPLHYAASKVPSEILELLCDKNPASLRIEVDNTKKLPIHLLCERAKSCANLTGGLQKMIELCPESLLHPDEAGNLPLHSLLLGKHPDLQFVKILISKNPAALQHKNKSGMLPIHLANDDMFLQCAQAFPGGLEERDGESTLPMVSWLRRFRMPYFRTRIFDQVLQVNAAEKAAMTSEIDFQNKMAAEARKIENAFRATILADETTASIANLKIFAESLKTRLDLTKAKLQPTSKPSFVQMNFPSLMNDPLVSRSSLVDCIKTLEAELSSLEEGAAEPIGSDNSSQVVNCKRSNEVILPATVNNENAPNATKQPRV